MAVETRLCSCELRRPTKNLSMVRHLFSRSAATIPGNARSSTWCFGQLAGCVMDISSIVALPTDWTSVHLLEFVRGGAGMDINKYKDEEQGWPEGALLIMWNKLCSAGGRAGYHSHCLSYRETDRHCPTWLGFDESRSGPRERSDVPADSLQCSKECGKWRNAVRGRVYV